MFANHAKRLTFIGFGEVAATLLTHAFGQLQDVAVSVFMPSTRQPSDATRIRLSKFGLHVSSAQEIISRASVILSAVAPAVALQVAQDISPYLAPGVLYVDMNSVSGQTMAQIAACVEEKGAHCVDAAIMGPVPVYQNRVPIFLSGAAAEGFLAIAQTLGLSNASVISERVGDASSLKMLWSVITKGTIALFAESLIAAHRLGLLSHLRCLLAQEYGNTGSDTMILRMLGSSAGGAARRLDEMEQAQRTLESAHVPAWATTATGLWIRALSQMPVPLDRNDVSGLVSEISAGLDTRSVQDTPSLKAEQLD
jgi:3-hydroxyisobutyrate dehydrogenase-like beta-hydroxyacid dehydrogenase